MISRKYSLAICTPSPSATLMKLFRPRFEDDPWEVVTSKTICPLPMDMCFEDSELDQLLVAKIHFMTRYDHEVKNGVSLALELQNAVIAAQQLLLERVEQNGCNVLVSESWGLTLFRRGKNYRIKVEYRARPAYAKDAMPPPSQREPPSLRVLQDLIHDVAIPTTTNTKVLHKRKGGYASLIKA